MPTRPGLSTLRPGKGRRAEARARQRLERELAAGREHPERAKERLGEPGAARPPGPLVWLHARCQSAAPDLLALIERLRLERDDLNCLVTTDRYSPDDLLRDHLPRACIHQFLPYGDGPGMERFLSHWRPDICIWADSDQILPLRDSPVGKDMPVFWINASLPDEKSHMLRWFGSTSRRVLRQFSRVFATDGRSARNLKRLGLPAAQLEVLGPVHESPPPLECAESEWSELAAILATRPVWFAARVSAAESRAIINAHRAISRRAHRYLLILLPHDIGKAGQLAQDLERDGWMIARRAAGAQPDAETQIFLADTTGEMGLWFRLAPISFIGQTLMPEGASPCDPYLATALGSVVLHGPQTGIFADRFERLRNAGAARLVTNEAALVQEMEHLQAPDKVASMAQAAWEVSTAGAEAVDRLCGLLHDSLNDRGI